MMTIIVIIGTATDIMTETMATGTGKIKTMGTGSMTEVIGIGAMGVNRSIPRS
jgi:hypothetical protein